MADARVDWGSTVFDTLYVGGGTPSTLGGRGIAALIDLCRSSLRSSSRLECTVELNPEHVDDELVVGLTSCGVTRVSLGVQTFSARGLGSLGRVHDAAVACRAVDQLLGAGLDVSVDLIVGWPTQTREEVCEDVRRVAALAVSHASVYALTIDDGVPWHKLVRRGLRVLPDGDAQADLLRTAVECLGTAGFDHYEISNHARAGKRSRHNEKYWTGIDYLGIGPSAASARSEADGSVIRSTNPRGLGPWLAPGTNRGGHEHLDPAAAASEAMWLGLRRLEGVRLSDLVRRFPAFDESWWRGRLSRQIARGNVVWDPQTAVVALASGRWLWHDEVGLGLLR